MFKEANLVKSGLFGVNPDHFRTIFFKKSPDPDQSPEKMDQMGALQRNKDTTAQKA